jgi:Spy/CpxP family protein refolding chaperone
MRNKRGRLNPSPFIFDFLKPFRYLLKYETGCFLYEVLAMKLGIAIVLLTLCFFAILPISPSFPQGSGMSHGPGMGMRKWRGEGPCWSASELNLSSEQKKGLDLIQQAYFREAQLFRLQLFTMNIELRELLTNPTTKVESIRGKYSEIIELQSKQEEKAVEYLIKVRGLLTPEQLKNWCPEQEFPAFRQMMHGMGPMGPKRFREE